MNLQAQNRVFSCQTSAFMQTSYLEKNVSRHAIKLLSGIMEISC
jgi:hypothetical protein